jgi:N-acetylmuramoyl-L-alanine amidase
MNLMTLAALCAAVARGGPVAPAGTDCAAVVHQYQTAIAYVAPIVNTSDARDAIARVAYAEAGNQGDSGLAGVVYAILNRILDGGFGAGVSSILDAPGQFEPVTKARGWRNLPARSPVEQAHIDTILNLALDGRLPDPTNGARYFQNPAVVASRVAAGTASPGVANFGGQKPVSVIRDHAFYGAPGPERRATVPLPSLFVPVQTAQPRSSSPNDAPPEAASALFVPVQSLR